MEFNNRFNEDLSGCLQDLDRLCNDKTSFYPSEVQLTNNVDATTEENWELCIRHVNSEIKNLLIASKYLKDNENVKSFLETLELYAKRIEKAGYYSDKNVKYFKRILEDREFDKMTHISY